VPSWTPDPGSISPTGLAGNDHPVHSLNLELRAEPATAAPGGTRSSVEKNLSKIRGPPSVRLPFSFRR